MNRLPDHPMEFVTILGFLVGSIAILSFIAAALAAALDAVFGFVDAMTLSGGLVVLALGAVAGWALRSAVARREVTGDE